MIGIKEFGGWRDCSVVRSTTALKEDNNGFPAPTWRLTTSITPITDLLPSSDLRGIRRSYRQNTHRYEGEKVYEEHTLVHFGRCTDFKEAWGNYLKWRKTRKTNVRHHPGNSFSVHVLKIVNDYRKPYLRETTLINN